MEGDGGGGHSAPLEIPKAGARLSYSRALFRSRSDTIKCWGMHGEREGGRQRRYKNIAFHPRPSVSRFR